MTQIKALTNEEILKGAIEKAVGNGYEGFKVEGKTIAEYDCQVKLGMRYRLHYAEIFSPEFAKAYWGEEETVSHLDATPVWQYHQHKMLDEVQAGREALLYIARFLDE